MGYEWINTTTGEWILARWCPHGFEAQEADTDRVPTWDQYLDSRQWISPKAQEEDGKDEAPVEAAVTVTAATDSASESESDKEEEEAVDEVIERENDPTAETKEPDAESAELTGLKLLEWVVQREDPPDVYHLKRLLPKTEDRDGLISLEMAWRCSENAFVRVCADLQLSHEMEKEDRADMVAMTIDKVGRGAGENTIKFTEKEVNGEKFLNVNARRGRAVVIDGRLPRGPYYQKVVRHKFVVDRVTGGTKWFSGSPGTSFDSSLKIDVKEQKKLEAELATWNLPAPPESEDGGDDDNDGPGEQEISLMQAVFDDSKKAFLAAATDQIVKPTKVPKDVRQQCQGLFFIVSQSLNPDAVRAMYTVTSLTK